MAIECFKIEWKSFPSLDDARNSPQSREDGIYIFYKGKIPKYIGKSKEINRRLGEHRQYLSHSMGERLNELPVCLGMIYKFENAKISPHISPEELKDIESFFINKIPNLNSEQTKRSYKGKDLIIINCGEYVSFSSLMAFNDDFLDLLVQNSKKYVPLKNITTPTRSAKITRRSPKNESPLERFDKWLSS